MDPAACKVTGTERGADPDPATQGKGGWWGGGQDTPAAHGWAGRGAPSPSAVGLLTLAWGTRPRESRLLKNFSREGLTGV